MTVLAVVVVASCVFFLLMGAIGGLALQLMALSS